MLFIFLIIKVYFYAGLSFDIILRISKCHGKQAARVNWTGNGVAN